MGDAIRVAQASRLCTPKSQAGRLCYGKSRARADGPAALLLGLEHEQICHGRPAVGIPEAVVLLAVDPDGIRLPRLQLDRQYTGSLVPEILRLPVHLGEALLGERRPRPGAVLHIFAEG